MNIEAFHSFVLTEVLGCPVPLLNARIVAAASEFCRETLSWTETQDPLPLIDGVADYDIDFPSSAYALTVLGAWIGTRKLEAIAEDVSIGASSAPTHYNAINEFGVLRVYPTPSNPTESLMIKASYAPTPTATSLPDFLVRFTDVIASGAKADLMTMPAVSWSNPELAAFYRARFQVGIADARISDMHGRVSGSVSVKPRLFI